MSRITTTIVLGLLLTLIGVVSGSLEAIRNIEEDSGLGLLFTLRGVKTPPPQAVIVSIDRESSEQLKVPDNPDRWPRTLHARLVDFLAKQGASVIVFDLYFIDPRLGAEDTMLASAISTARNVVLAEPLKARNIPAAHASGASIPEHKIVESVKPIPAVAEAAFASAPFVLPKLPIKVNQYWTFQTAAADSPTFPVVAFQLYALSAYDEFIRLLKTVDPKQVQSLPEDVSIAFQPGATVRRIREIRAVFENTPVLAARASAALRQSDLSRRDPQKYSLVESLLGIYSGPNHRYLNYYGPPRTLTTIPFFQVLQMEEGSGGARPIDFSGKVVFIGLSEIALTERKDSFYTTFSRSDGVFLSGAEIAATAFSNILQNNPVTPLSPGGFLGVIVFWAIILAAAGRLATTPKAAAIIVGASFIYLVAAVYKFDSDGTWYPIVVPLFIQSPLALTSAVLWNYFETNKERRNIRKALSFYVPDEVVDHLAANIADMRRNDQTVYGVCLFTDCARYTSVSESMTPRELSDFMHKYFVAIFEPIKQNGGRVVDLEGDAVLAVWRGARDDTAMRKQACMAALSIARAVHRFNESLERIRLPTRIAIHAGEVFFGNLGTPDHYKYGVMGDTVNTASRMDGLNKYLGTEILVSDEVIQGVDGFLTREAGTFIFKGKVQPIRVHELLCSVDEAAEVKRNACAIFAEALSAFRCRSWPQAKEKFEASAALLEGDSLARFYLALSERYKTYPPREPWEGVVELEDK